MKRIVYVALAALVCSTWVSGLIADTYTDDFEAYPDGLLPSPWSPVNGIEAASGEGYGDPDPSVGARVFSGAHSRWHALRLTGGVCTLLNAKLKFTPENMSQATIGLATNNTQWTYGGGWTGGDVGSDCVYVVLIQSSSTTADIHLRSVDRDEEGAEVEGGTRTMSDVDLQPDTWYQVEMMITEWDVSCVYYPVDNPGMITPMGSVQLPPGFATNYVGIETSQQGVVDDIEVTAGPTTLGSINLTINLLDYTGDVSLMRVNIQVLDGDGLIVQSSQVTPTSTTESHMLLAIPEGTYSVKVSAPKWLSKVTTGVVVTAGVTTPAAVSLPNGDYDGDDEVTTTDVSVGVSNKDQVGN